MRAHRMPLLFAIAGSFIGVCVAAPSAAQDPALLERAVKPVRWLEGHTDGVHCVAFSPDGTKLVTAGHDRSARLWDVATGKEIRRFEAHTGIVYGAAFSRDGRRVATCGQDGLVVVWETDTGQVLAMFEGHTRPVYHVAFLPDGTVATASRDGTLRRWKVEDETELASREAHDDGVYAMAVSRDGRRIATGGMDGVVIVWDAAKFQPLWRIAPPPPPQRPRPAEPLRVPQRPPGIIQVAFGQTSAAADAAKGPADAGGEPALKLYTLSHSGLVHEWDGTTGEALRVLDAAGPSMCIAVSPDGRRAVIASYDGPHLWDLETMKMLAPLLPQDYTHGLDFSPDGRLVAVAPGGWQSAGRGWVRPQDPRVPIWDIAAAAAAGKK